MTKSEILHIINKIYKEQTNRVRLVDCISKIRVNGTVIKLAE